MPGCSDTHSCMLLVAADLLCSGITLLCPPTWGPRTRGLCLNTKALTPQQYRRRCSTWWPHTWGRSAGHLGLEVAGSAHARTANWAAPCPQA